MREVFEQYGSAIITVVCVLALISIASLLLTNDSTGLVYGAFVDLFKSFNSGGAQ